jgi:hypothetical protein
MNRETKRSSSTSARKLFLQDIEDTEKYLTEMQSYIKELCNRKKLEYPHRGRGRKGMFPNIPYALHFRLNGYKPKEAAKMYVEREQGSALQPLDGDPVECPA